MKALVAKTYNLLAYTEVEEPDLNAGEVLIEVAACGICGTDMHVYKGMPSNWPTPGVRGHEFAGVVAACAADVDRVKVGDRVVVQPMIQCGQCRYCRACVDNLCANVQLIGGERPGGFAERVVVPAQNVFSLPDELPLKHAALVEPLATAVHAFERHYTADMKSMVIFGAGVQGLLLLQVASMHGIERIAVTDVFQSRLDQSVALGATRAIQAASEDVAEALLAMNNGEPIDVAVDAAGLVSTRQQAIACLKSGGTAIFLALGPAPTPVDFMAVVGKELKLVGTQCYTQADFAKSIQYLAEKRIDAEALLTEVPLREGAQAFSTLASDPGGIIKAILVPTG